MSRWLNGFLIAILLMSCAPVHALRSSQPPTITQIDSNTLAQLNQTLQDLWNITNGRYTPNAVTADPDGTLKGGKYDLLVYDPTGAGFNLCVNSDGNTTWMCVALS